MEKKEIAVVGAGLVGSLISIFMAKRGHSVKVYERRSDMRKAGAIGGRSINLALSDRGFRALERVGIADEIRKLCIPIHGRMMHAESGELTSQPYGKEGQFINSVSRGALNKKLVEVAESFEKVEFLFDQKCVKYDTKSTELLMQDQLASSNYTIKPDMIIGADGAFSRVRYSLQKGPRFNYSQDYLPHGYKELRIPPGENGSYLIEKHALHIWPRTSFMLMALPNLDGSFTCTLFAPFEGKDSFESIKTDEDVKAFFNLHFPDAVPLMPTLVEDWNENPTSSLVTVKCWPWSYKNVLLIGDASHAVVPFYGQGMNSGFEDCTILDEFMDKYEDWDEMIDAYDNTRKVDADAISVLAKRNFVEMRDKVADPLFLLRKKIAAHIGKLHPEFIPVYSMVTFSHLPYSQALAEMDRQDKVFEDILSWDGIEEKWDSAYLSKIESLLLS
ncbi:MAG: kynurenine 3-monooxygenase [Limisphaerales bacterium]